MHGQPKSREPDPRAMFHKMILGIKDDSGKRVIPYKTQQKILKKPK